MKKKTVIRIVFFSVMSFIQGATITILVLLAIFEAKVLPAIQEKNRIINLYQQLQKPNSSKQYQQKKTQKGEYCFILEEEV